jgi:hypothetical protein
MDAESETDTEAEGDAELEGLIVFEILWDPEDVYDELEIDECDSLTETESIEL